MQDDWDFHDTVAQRLVSSDVKILQKFSGCHLQWNNYSCSLSGIKKPNNDTLAGVAEAIIRHDFIPLSLSALCLSLPTSFSGNAKSGII